MNLIIMYVMCMNVHGGAGVYVCGRGQGLQLCTQVKKGFTKNNNVLYQLRWYMVRKE